MASLPSPCLALKATKYAWALKPPETSLSIAPKSKTASPNPNQPIMAKKKTTNKLPRRNTRPTRECFVDNLARGVRELINESTRGYTSGEEDGVRLSIEVLEQVKEEYDMRLTEIEQEAESMSDEEE